MVIAESMRTFTYLSLYGYLTDAVVVNRVFPEEVDGTYFGAWRELQHEQLELVESGFSPVPVLRAPYFEQEVIGPQMLDRLADSLFEGRDAGAVLHDSLAQELSLDGDHAELRLDLPFARQGRHLAEEDRPRARRARGRPEAHDHPAARPRPLPSRVGLVHRRRAAGELRWLSATRWRRCATRSMRPTRPPTGWCARPRRPRASAPARFPSAAGRARAPSASAARSRSCRRWRGCWRPSAARSRLSSRASSARRCASCCSPCGRCWTGGSSGSTARRRRPSRCRTSPIE